MRSSILTFSTRIIPLFCIFVIINIFYFIFCTQYPSIVPTWSQRVFHLYHSSDVNSLTATVSSLQDVTVTRHIHQTWKTHDLPPRFQLYSSSWKRNFPHWKYTLWNDTENRDFIRTNFSWFLPTYDSFPHNIYRADAIRYFLMYAYGGVYADLDTDCLHPFEHLLVNHSIVFGAMEGTFAVAYDGVYVQNSFFYSRPGHPFWMDVAKEMMRIKSGPQAEWVTGPIMLTGLMNKLRPKYEKDWKVYAPNYFNPFSWIHNSHPLPAECKSLNKMTNEDLEKCRQYFLKRPNTYVVQYHSQTWGAGKTL